MQLEDVAVGMLVMATTDRPSGNQYLTAGDIGTVVHIYEVRLPPIGVDWGRDVHGHMCAGHCADTHGWAVRPDEIMPVCEEDDTQYVDLSGLL